MQVIDSLAAGGAESIAVTLSNMLPRDRFESFLCATRHSGPLADRVAPHVIQICLGRRGRFDGRAIGRIRRIIRERRIQILHAHGSSLFVARLASFAASSPALIIWHDHYGRAENRPRWLYRIGTSGVGVIAVTPALAEWSRTALGVPPERVWYVPNWVETFPQKHDTCEELPGITGHRIVCVANLREQKDHLNLLRAAALLRDVIPDVHVLLVGHAAEPRCAEQVGQEIGRLHLRRHVTYLGPRQDVAAILSSCDVGALSSASEGLPLALLEYGAAGLPVVATDVGQCGEVLDGGRAGLLVRPAAPDELADALRRLLESEAARRSFGSALRARVLSNYSPKASVEKICGIYGALLASQQASKASNRSSLAIEREGQPSA